MSQYLIAHIGHTTKSCEHITWWKPDSRGYTVCIDKAGLYEETQARRICESSGICIAMPLADAKKLARTTPYYRRSNGELARLYDGGPHAVVPNGRTEWQLLMAARINCGKAEKPTPVGAKARAIYLPAEFAPSPAAKEGAQQG